MSRGDRGLPHTCAATSNAVALAAAASRLEMSPLLVEKARFMTSCAAGCGAVLFRDP